MMKVGHHIRRAKKLKQKMKINPRVKEKHERKQHKDNIQIYNAKYWQKMCDFIGLYHFEVIVAELKIRENNSHCRSIVLKTMDCSIVKQLEKEKNSNFNVENFVVMFIY
jgi:hypothetical protein